MTIDDTFLDAFENDMARLSRRTYAEVGVPMFLVPEDLTGANPAPAEDPGGAKLSAEFVAICAALEKRNGEMTHRDIAHVIEVLADRSFLDEPFSSLCEGQPA